VAYNWPLGAAVSVVIVLLTVLLLSLVGRVERLLGGASPPSAEAARGGLRTRT
jgi:ABC-type spermidine/putrescine transport system permease subunit I